MENKFAIGIPTLNRLDLLHPALLFYLRDLPTTKIFVVDNGQQGISTKVKHPNLFVTENEANVGVATSWNMLCDAIFKDHDYAIILNDDIYWGRKEYEIDNLLTNHNNPLFCSTQDWCAFIIGKKVFNKVGRFDEDFYPAYYEDNDYTYRMRLMGMSVFKIPFMNPFMYETSQTLEREPSLRQLILENKQRYIKKWGGEPTKEKFKTPYNK
jgi:GT2 family glycosyltransferase